MKNLFRAVILVGLCAPTAAFAQAFVQAYDNLSNLESYLILKDGTRLEGKIASASIFNGEIKAFKFNTGDGKPTKYKPEDVSELGNKISDLMKAGAMMDKATKWNTAFTGGYGSIAEQEYAIYRDVPWKGKKTKLLQLVNAGFSNGIEVFNDPAQVESSYGGFDTTGTQYIFVRDGKELRVKGSNYGKYYEDLFAGCDEVLKHESAYNKKGKLAPKAEDMAAHVFIFSQTCGGGGVTPAPAAPAAEEPAADEPAADESAAE